MNFWKELGKIKKENYFSKLEYMSKKKNNCFRSKVGKKRMMNKCIQN